MLVVVGGHARKTGKTAVVCSLIRAVAEAGWTAVKIARHPHGAGVYQIDEETVPGATDTGRYLAAGARRAFLVRTAPGGLAAAMPAVRGILDLGPHAIVESNSILEFVRPDLYLAVAAADRPDDFKESAGRYFARADAVVVVDTGHTAGGRGVPETWSGRPCFPVASPVFASPELAALVRARL